LIVRLNADEARLAWTIAKTRNDRDVKSGVVDRLAALDGRDKTLNTYHSFGAELAVAKALNIYPDLNTDPTCIRSADLVTQHGVLIDVKWTRKARVSIPNNRRRTDVYVVVTGECPRYEVVGFVYRDRARSETFWAKDAPVPCWQVPFDVLDPIRSPLDLRGLRRAGTGGEEGAGVRAE
jgi:hypothetical protein